MARDPNARRPPCPLGGPPSVLLCYSGTAWSQLIRATTEPPKKKPDPVTSETVVIWGLRLWQVVGIFAIFLLSVIITLCCIFKCRIPRTKKEIEARYTKRQAAKMYADKLDTVPPLNELTEIPGAPGPGESKEEEEEVPTISGKVDAQKKKERSKDSKKEKKKQQEEKEDREGPEKEEKEGAKRKQGKKQGSEIKLEGKKRGEGEKRGGQEKLRGGSKAAAKAAGNPRSSSRKK